MGMDVFGGIDRDAPLIVAEAVWQYSHHVLPGLRRHRGPILTVANWSGEWPGLVGMLNINASLTKMGRPYSSIWSEDLTDAFADEAHRALARDGHHRARHVATSATSTPRRSPRRGSDSAGGWPASWPTRMAILGVFDEGCMGMYNAIIDDEYLQPDRPLQGAPEPVGARRRDAPGQRRRGPRRAIAGSTAQGMKFRLGSDGATELTEDQVLDQLRLYIAAVRIADEFGCDAIGIQYQQGLKDLAPASDLAEGLLNDADRPPVAARRRPARELYAGRPLPHFNEVDEGVGLDAPGDQPGLDGAGLRPGDHAPRRPLGRRRTATSTCGSSRSRAPCRRRTSSAASRAPSASASRRCTSASAAARSRASASPGEIVWSRVFIMDGALHADIGRGTVVELPAAETERRWQATTPQWPIMHAVLHGVTRDQMMARHKANHIQVAYGGDAAVGRPALRPRPRCSTRWASRVHLCGEVRRSAEAPRPSAAARRSVSPAARRLVWARRDGRAAPPSAATPMRIAAVTATMIVEMALISGVTPNLTLP